MKSIEKGRKLRLKIIGVCFICAFMVICVRVVYLQVFCHQFLSQQAANQYERSYVSEGKRGSIYDRNYREIAVSIDVTSITANPYQIEDRNAAAAILAKELKLEKSAVAANLSSKRRFVWIKRQAAPAEAAAIRQYKLKGLDFLPEYSRFYPNRTLAAQLIGFTGVDGNGLEGIEYHYDAYLKGDDSTFTMLKDALGRTFVKEFSAVEQRMEPMHRGNNLVLTIDRTIQFIAEKTLQETIGEFDAKSGLAIVMVPGTGEILALAQYPFFNPHNYQSSNAGVWRNRAITDVFEPGSSVKVFSAAAALESGVCTPNTIFYCENGVYKLGKTTVKDVSRYGWLSLTKVIKHSSNIGMVKVSQMVGAEAMHRTLRGFGFGERTGIDCPGEALGSMAPYDRWTSIDTGVISYGYGISVSAIQLITAFSAIANDGALMKPYVVQAVTDSNGGHIQSYGPCKVKTAVSVDTARTIRAMMQTVVEKGGTGENAALDGYTSCGKTGTAIKINNKGEYLEGIYISSFIGFAPVEKPEIAVLVIIDEPVKKYYGGAVAAPAFKKIAQETLHYLNIAPRSLGEKLLVTLDPAQPQRPNSSPLVPLTAQARKQ